MLNVDFNAVMGQITIKQREKEYTLDICQCNALASLIYKYVDKDGKNMCQLYTFFADKKHCQNIVKHHGKLMNDEIVNITLNLWYKESKTLLDFFLKDGHQVTCYRKEPEKK